MDSVLIVSHIEKSTAFFREMLAKSAFKEIAAVTNCGEAKRLFIERDFDLILINTPLADEFGERFAREVASKSISQVILVVKAELFDEISEKVEDTGVLTIAKPINRGLFWSAVKLAGASYNKMSAMHRENKSLLRKIEDIRMVDRAKCILIQYLGMSEQEAHKYIERQAMDMRLQRREVAENILRTYES